jgi:hypothetical protein
MWKPTDWQARVDAREKRHWVETLESYDAQENYLEGIKDGADLFFEALRGLGVLTTTIPVYLKPSVPRAPDADPSMARMWASGNTPYWVIVLPEEP